MQLFKLLILALLCGSLHAQTMRFYPKSCVVPKKVYRGKPFYIQCSTTYYNTFPVTNINSAALTVTAPGHDLVVGDIINFMSSDVNADYTQYGLLPDVFPGYTGFTVWQVNGDVLRFTWEAGGNINQVVEFGTNLGSAYAGGELVIGTSTSGAHRVSNFTVSSGLSIAGTWYMGGNSIKIPISPVSGVYSMPSGFTRFNSKIDVADNAPLGTATITMTVESNNTCCTGQTRAYSWNVEVLDTKTLVPWLGNRPAAVAWPVGLLGNVENIMTTQLNNYCDTATGAIKPGPTYGGGGLGNDITYYDGTDTYDQAAAYFNVPVYAQCSDYIARNGLNTYVYLNQGIIQIFMGFTKGYSSKARFGKGGGPIGSYEMSTNPNSALKNNINTQNIRPTFFNPSMAMSVIGNAGYTPATIPPKYIALYDKAVEAVEYLLINLDTFAEMGTTYASQYNMGGFPYNQNFMVGYTLRSLLEWWEWHGRTDNRIPYNIKRYMDMHNSWLWLPAHNTIRWAASLPAAGTSYAWLVEQNAGVTGNLSAPCPGPTGCTLTFTSCPATITAGEYVYFGGGSTTINPKVVISEAASSTCTSGASGTINVITDQTVSSTWDVRGRGFSGQGFGCAASCYFNAPQFTGTQLAAMSIPFNAWLWMNGAGDSYRAFYDAQMQAFVTVYPDGTVPKTPKAMNEEATTLFRGIYWRNLQIPPRQNY